MGAIGFRDLPTRLAGLAIEHDLYARQFSKFFKLPREPFLVNVVREVSNEEVLFRFIVISRVGLGLLRDRRSFGFGFALLRCRSCLLGALLVGIRGFGRRFVAA